MNLRLHPSRIVLIVASILLARAAVAVADAPEYEYVAGEPYRENLPRELREFANYVVVFETTPSSEFRFASHRDELLREAIQKSFEEFRLPTDVYDKLRDASLRNRLIRMLPTEKSTTEPPRDRWMVLGVDEAMVKTLVGNLLQGAAVHIDRRLLDARADVSSARARLTDLGQQAAEAKAKFDEALEKATEAGVLNMDRSAIPETAKQLRLDLAESRIDVAELEARLKAARQEEAEHSRSERVTSVPVLQKLVDLQSNLEIDLAGKLARVRALESEIDVLAGVYHYRSAIEHSKHWELERAVERGHREIESREQIVAELESAGPFRVIDGKIAISPIATNEGEQVREP